jgi:hypothetical protein
VVEHTERPAGSEVAIEDQHVLRESLTMAFYLAPAAAVVATLASLPFLLTDGASAAGYARLLLAGMIGVFAFGTARRHGATAWRAAAYATVVVTIAATVALVKNALAGH